MSIFSSTKSVIKNFVSPCYACCSFISVDQSGFCAQCKQHLFEKFSADKRAINGLETTSLFDWVANANRPLSLLLEDMKGGKNPIRSRYYGVKVLTKFLQIQPMSKNAIVVPAPAKKFFERDHACLLAESIGQITGWEICPGLGRLDMQSQKHKKRDERKKTELSFESFSIDTFRYRPVIFVDDIVTTGATAQAAYKALGQPAQFHVLSVARRRLSLAGAEGL